MDEKRMSEQTPYEILQVAEDASFEEIQVSRDRLLEGHNDDEKQRQQIEAAYDAILMDRLRRRQEGKIKVPERIRYAERLSEEPPPNANPPRLSHSALWLRDWLDTPTGKELAIATAVYGSLAGFSFVWTSNDSLAFLLSLGFGFNLYWMARKEQKLGRAFLLTLAGLVLGGLLGTVLVQVAPQLLATLSAEDLVTLVILFLLWLSSNFLR